MVIIVRDPQIETRYNGIKQYTVYVVETEVSVKLSNAKRNASWKYLSRLLILNFFLQKPVNTYCCINLAFIRI